MYILYSRESVDSVCRKAQMLLSRNNLQTLKGLDSKAFLVGRLYVGMTRIT